MYIKDIFEWNPYRSNSNLKWFKILVQLCTLIIEQGILKSIELDYINLIYNIYYQREGAGHGEE